VRPEVRLETERLTLGVLLCGVASLSLSDFVSPVYWSVVTGIAVIRLWRGPAFCLSEMQASLIGWAGFFWVGLELLLGRDFLVAFTDFLLILSLAVVIEAATPRNHLHRLITGQFLVLAAAVLTDSVLYALPLAAFVALMWRASRRLYGIDPVGPDLPLGGWGRDMNTAVLLIVASVLLFVLLPRTGIGTAFRNVQRQLATSGFSDRVQFGDFARVLDPTVIMRVEPGPGADVDTFRRRIMSRYWRGVSLSRFAGTGWRQGPEHQVSVWNAHQNLRFAEEADIFPVTVYREAVDHAYVFVPGGLVGVRDIPSRLGLTATGSLKFTERPARRLRLMLWLGARNIPPHSAPPDRWASAPVREPGIAAWAGRLGAGIRDPAAKLEKIAAELRSWSYDLNAPIDPVHPVSRFVLRTHRGHCELFASALALAARALGIPARVVNGYYGGDWNDVGRFLLIRQQHAHAWVEAWVDGRWRRFDPTPPARWQLSGVRFEALDHIWESVKLAWYRYVLEFRNQDRAGIFAVLRSILRSYGIYLLLLFFCAAAVWRGMTRMRRHWSRQSAWPVLDRWLRQRGMRRPPHQPLRALPRPAGVEAGRWQRFVTSWEQQAFGASPRWGRRQLRRHLRALSAARW